MTGCNRGIGLAVVKKFAEEGANLICATRKDYPEFRREMEILAAKKGVAADFIFFDLADEESIKAAIKNLENRKVSVDILVNNAGILSGGLMLMTPVSRIKEVMQINFFSQVLVTQLVAKMMIKRKRGAIVNMVSVAALDNQGALASYGSSKGAMVSFTRTCAKELSAFGIRVNAVAPGLIDTEMGGTVNEKYQEEMLSRSSLKRPGRPEEVADLISFLCSDESSYMTGQIIRIDGGM